jgi:tRNA A37 threonylcarbamoyladenosine modification protein TsaB
MRVLAIDTALEACSAAVLDTERRQVASESLPMLRGHAEALMPLIARVMRQADIAFSALDRIAVTTGPAASPACASASRRRAASRSPRPSPRRSDDARGLCRAAYRPDDKTAVAVAIDARHQHVYLQIFGPAGAR